MFSVWSPPYLQVQDSGSYVATPNTSFSVTTSRAMTAPERMLGSSNMGNHNPRGLAGALQQQNQ